MTAATRRRSRRASSRRPARLLVTATLVAALGALAAGSPALAVSPGPGAAGPTSDPRHPEPTSIPLLQADGALSAAAATGPNPALGPMVTRAQIMRNALGWLALDPPYSQTHYFHGIANPTVAYRTDCSGFVSMAWQTRVNTNGSNTTGGYVTWTLPSIAVRLSSVWDLQPGDILDYPSHHVILFTGWRDKTKGIFSFIQQTAPGLNMLMEDTESVLSGDIAGYPYNVFIPYRYVNAVSSGASGVRGDFDSDGAVDILATNGGNTLYFYEGNGHGGFAFGHAAPVSTGMKGYVSVVRSPSMSSGSRAPYLIGLDTTGTLWLQPTTGYGSFGPRVRIGDGFTGDQVVAPGDVTGDGFSDLLVVSPAGAMQLYAGNGHAGFAAPVPVWGSWYGLRLQGAGDLDGDGRPDVVATTPAGALIVYPGSATKVLGSPRVVGRGWASTWKLAAVGDWTGDRKQDLLAIDPAGELWAYPGTGTGTFGARVHVASHWGAMSLL